MTDEVRLGRPRSEQARIAVLHAVDDLLLEVGYAAMTMKGIAERAGVGRQTVYRWWSTKAEILFEASVLDAQKELATKTSGDAQRDVSTYLAALRAFLTTSPAGAAYRALVSAAQQDDEVAALIARTDVLLDSASAVLRPHNLTLPLDQAAALLVGPMFFWVMAGRDASRLRLRAMAEAFLRTALA